MQRKDIDETEYADLRDAMADATVSEGAITLTMGQHALHGALVLIAAAGAYTVLGNDIRLVVGRDETLESDMAAAA